MSKITMKKKLLSPLILLLLALSLLSGLSVNTTRVSADGSYAIYIEEPVVEGIEPNNIFIISIKTNYTGKDIAGWQFTLSYNPFVLSGLTVTNGDLIVEGWAANRSFYDPQWYPDDLEFKNTANGTFSPGMFDNEAGQLNLTAGFFSIDYKPMPVVSGAPGPKTLANVAFEVLDWGDSYITLGPETKLFGYTNVKVYTDELGNELYGGWGTDYKIVDASTEPEKIVHGYFKNTDVTHNVAVLSVTVPPDPVMKGGLVDITVVVENQGTATDSGALVTERFDVTAFYDIYNPIETKTVSLNKSDSERLIFTWDTTYASVAPHIISAKASTVFNETDTADNTFIDGTVEVLPAFEAVIVAPSIENYHEDILFDASGSIGDIDTYFWDFGDAYNDTTGEPIIITTTEPNITHRYAQPGVYGVWLKVNSTTGEVSDPAYHTIEIIYPHLADLVKWKLKPEAHHWVYKNRPGSDIWTGNGTQTTFNTTLKPIVEDSEEVYVQFTETWPADSETIFTTTVTPLIDYLTIEQTTLDYTEEVYVNFTDTWEGDGETTKFFTTHAPILPGSERVYVNESRVYRDADYTIAYTQGRIEFITPVSGNKTGEKPEPGAGVPGVGANITAIYTVLMWRDHDYTIDYATGTITFITLLEPEGEVVRVLYMGNVTKQPAYYSIDPETGTITFAPPPEKGAEIVAKYEYNVLVLTALATNWGSKPINVTVTFEILDRGGLAAGPVIVEDLTLKVPSEHVPVIALIDPFACEDAEGGWHPEDNPKVVVYACVSLTYDSDADGIPDEPASTKIVRITIVA